jgi:hypothetical protein
MLTAVFALYIVSISVGLYNRANLATCPTRKKAAGVAAKEDASKSSASPWNCHRLMPDVL